MCIVKAPKDNSAAIARSEEERRQARIREGRTAIDKQFGQFDDSYYGGIEKDFLNFYTPQVDRQYRDARESTIYDLARTRNIDSSAGIDRMGDLQRTLADKKAMISGQARDARLQQKGRVESTRSDLYSQLSGTADPVSAANSAIALSSSLNALPQYSPIADLFANFTGQAANAVQAKRAGYEPRLAPISFGSSGGSARVVN